jgi:hypothetical protein
MDNNSSRRSSSTGRKSFRPTVNNIALELDFDNTNSNNNNVHTSTNTLSNAQSTSILSSNTPNQMRGKQLRGSVSSANTTNYFGSGNYSHANNNYSYLNTTNNNKEGNTMNGVGNGLNGTSVHSTHTTSRASTSRAGSMYTSASSEYLPSDASIMRFNNNGGSISEEDSVHTHTTHGHHHNNNHNNGHVSGFLSVSKLGSAVGSASVDMATARVRASEEMTKVRQRAMVTEEERSRRVVVSN